MQTLFFPNLTLPIKTTLSETLKEASFNLVNENITDANFPLFGMGWTKIDVLLVRGKFTSSEAMEEILSKGYNPAIIEVMIALRSMPKIEDHCPIIGPGSSWKDSEEQLRTPAIWGDKTRIHLYLDWFAMQHTCNFAGFKKSNQ